jgi:DNA polymerase V
MENKKRTRRTPFAMRILFPLTPAERIFRPGYAYQRVGVLLPDLVPAGTEQVFLFTGETEDSGRSERLMEVMDEINHVYGRHTLRYAGEGLSDQWRMRQRLKSPSYTTDWRDLSYAKC